MLLQRPHSLHQAPRPAPRAARMVAAKSGNGAAGLAVDVAIAGAGPAGLACAAALLRADPKLTVRLFERGDLRARGAAVNWSASTGCWL